MLVCEVLLMILSGGLLFALAPHMLRLFSSDLAVIALATVVLRMVALSEPFYGVSIITEGMMQGVGNTKVPFAFNVLGMWGIRILGTFVCVVHLIHRPFAGSLRGPPSPAGKAFGKFTLHRLIPETESYVFAP